MTTKDKPKPLHTMYRNTGSDFIKIKIHRGSKVKINCPRPDIFPAFNKRYGGRIGKVYLIEPLGAKGVVMVDMSNNQRQTEVINVESGWLSHA